MKRIKTSLLLFLILFVSPFLLSACSFTLKRTLKANMVSLEQTSYVYDGTEKKPNVTVTLYKTQIIPDTDYTVTYENNIEVGEASVIVTMNDDCQRLTGSVTIHFSITGMEIGEISTIPDAVYNGQNQQPIVLIDGLNSDTDYELSWEYKTIGSDESDYSPLSTNEFINAGNYKVTATGKGIYAGTQTAVYTINKATYSNLSVTRSNYTFSEQPTDIILSTNVFGSVTYYYSTNSNLSSPAVFDKNTTFSCGTYYFYAQVAETTNSLAYQTPTSYFTVLQYNVKDLQTTIQSDIYEYTGNAIYPEITIANGTNTLVLNQDYTISYENNTYVGVASIIVSGKGNYTGTKTINFTIENSNQCTEHDEADPVTTITKKATVSEDGEYFIATYCSNCGSEITKQTYKINKINADSISIESIAFDYDGFEKTPAITIDGLELDRDYVVTYNNNVNAGTAEAIITFTGLYEGTITKQFAISKVVVEKPTFTTSEFTYTGESHTATLSHTSDYFEIKGNLTQTNAGVYNVTISLKDKNNYIWKNSNDALDFNLIFSIHKVIVDNPTLVNSNFTYNKAPHTVSLSYTSDEFNVNGSLFETNAGTYHITISLKDKVNYIWKNANNSEDLILEYTIDKAKIEKPVLTTSEFTYNGEVHTTTLSYTDNNFVVTGNLSETNAGTYNITVALKDKSNFVWDSSYDSHDLVLSFTIHQLVIDEPTLNVTEFTYTGEAHTATLSYLNEVFSVSDNLTQTNTGTYKVIVSLKNKNNYIWKNANNSEDLSLEFTIKGVDISSATVSLSAKTFVYTSEACLPEVTVVFNGKTLSPFVDYLPIATNNINVGTATITVYGLTNYSGEVATTFQITPQKVTEPTVTGNYNYNGQPQSAKFTGNTSLFTASGHIQTDVGTYDIKITLNDKHNYVWEQSGNTDDLTLQFTISGTVLNNLTVEFLTSYHEYTGTEIKPQVLVKLGRVLLVESTDYTLTYKNNINAGTATIEINGISSYEGVVSRDFTISPKPIDEPTITGTYVYNGAYQTAQITNNNSLFVVTNNKQCNAGTYIVKVELNDKSNYIWKTSKNTDAVELEFVISPIEVNEPTITGNYLYDGSEKTAKLSYTSMEFTTSNNIYTDAGIHYVKVSLKNKNNYVWKTSKTSDDLSLEFVIDESKVEFVDSDSYLHNLASNSTTLSSIYSLSDHYLFMPENQFDSKLSWIFASLKTLETSILRQNPYGEYHNFSEIGSAYLYYKNYVSSKYNYSDIKDIDIVGDFYKFNLTAQNDGIFYENTMSNDLYFSLSKSNYQNFSYLEKHLNSSVMNSLKPIDISGSSYFKGLDQTNKIELLKQYINAHGGVYTTLGRGIISCTSYLYSTLNSDETSNNDSDGFISSSQSVCIIGWNDSKNAFYAVNSWGVDESSYDYFWIPYSYSEMYNELFGYIYNSENDNVKIETSYSGGSNGFTSKFMTSGNNPANLFVYEEVFSISYNFASGLNLNNINIVAYQGDYNVSSLFNFEKSNNILTITAKDVTTLSGTYIFEFYLNSQLIYSKDVYVFTGTEVSYVQLLGGAYKTEVGGPVLSNNFASGLHTQTFYVADPYDSNYYLDFYLPGINSYTYNNTSISIGDIFITYTDYNGNILTRKKSSSDILKVTLESPNQFIPNRQRVLISHLFRTAFDSIVEINIKLKSPSSTGTGKTTIYKFIFIVSENTKALKDENNKIIYHLNGGLNNDKNITKYANYSVDTTITGYNLYDPTKENSTFLGWYLDENFTQQITVIDSSLSGEIVLYAKWSN